MQLLLQGQSFILAENVMKYQIKHINLQLQSDSCGARRLCFKTKNFIRTNLILKVVN